MYWHLFAVTINYDSLESVTVYNLSHSSLDYECLPFCVSDLLLIYESANSSASVARWLTLHS
jgi:hypothetical protein